jgi:endonuclease/exonuclease/phosphatase family metal-dependent hydrolase
VLENLEDEKCILMGDFNLEPDSPILAPIRARMRDAAELFEGEKKSWPSDEPRVKIDYIFATPDVEILNADIPAIVASDHRPHTAEIKL